MVQEKNEENDEFEEEEEKKVLDVKQQVDREMFMNTPLFGEYGEVKVKREAVRLTEQDFEIGVTVTKYLFEESILLEFSVTSSLENTQLVDLRVEVETNSDNLQVQHVERLACLKTGETQTVRLGLALDPENRVAVA